MATANPLPFDPGVAVDEPDSQDDLAAVAEARARIARGETTSRELVLAALDRAPVGEPFPPEMRVELDRRLEDLRSGRVQGIPHAEVQRALRERRERAG